MIIYESTIAKFISDCVDPSVIAKEVSTNLRLRLGQDVDHSLFESFYHSLPSMAEVLHSPLFNQELNVAIEYTLATRSRADFIVYGLDEFGHDNLVVIELKQWSAVERSRKQDYIYTNGGDGLRDYWHPSIQAYNYIHLLKLFNEYVRDNNIELNACSFLHNMDEGFAVILRDEVDFPIVTKAPTYLKEDADQLREFIHRHVQKPCKSLLYYIDSGRISPSPELAKMLEDALKGNPFFSYDQNQSEAVATIVEKAKDAMENNKRATIIIHGGPGTGKSIVAINALGQIVNTTKPKSNRHYNAVYVTQNMAPRNFYKATLHGGDFKVKDITNFFKSPVLFYDAPEMEYDCVLVDEAHRVYSNKFDRYRPNRSNVNLLEQVIRASVVNVFFIDEDQAVTKDDYATATRIKELAKKYHSPVIEGKELTLTSQFRCVGGALYIDWVKGLLGYPGHLPFQASFKDYDVQVFSSPLSLKKAIFDKNEIFHSSRLLAGYTHKWKSWASFKEGVPFEETPYDFEYPDGFKMRWNKGMKMVPNDYSYLDDPDSIHQIGCIHTIQGLDLQYAGVIIGKDLVYRDGKVTYLKENNVDNGSAKINQCDDAVAEKLIRNTYNVLLTRGMRGTYIDCEDEALNSYIKSLLK